MLARARTLLSFANIVSVTALFIALGAGAYAAGLAPNSVKSRHIKDGQVKLADLGGATAATLDEGTLTTVEGGHTQLSATGPVFPQDHFSATCPNDGLALRAEHHSTGGVVNWSGGVYSRSRYYAQPLLVNQFGPPADVWVSVTCLNAPEPE